MNIFYRIIILLFVNGMTALLALVILFKEMLAGAYNNEVILSCILAAWFLTGSFVFIFFHEKIIHRMKKESLLIVTGIMPVVNAFIFFGELMLVRYYKFFLGLPAGHVAGIWDAALAVMAIIIPPALSLSLTHAVNAELLHRQGASEQAKAVFGIESGGALAAGIIYTLFLAGRVAHTDIVFWTGMVSIASVYILFREKTKQAKIITAVVIVAAVLYMFFPVVGKLGAIEKNTGSMISPGYAVHYNEENKGSRVTLAKQDNKEHVFLNGELKYVPGNGGKISGVKGKNVLLVNNVYTGGVKRLVAGGAAKITAIEADAGLGNALSRLLPAQENNNTIYVHGSPEFYLLKPVSKEKFDAAFIYTGSLMSLSSARLLNEEIASLVALNMKEGKRPYYILPEAMQGMGESENTILKNGVYTRNLKRSLFKLDALGMIKVLFVAGIIAFAAGRIFSVREIRKNPAYYAVPVLSAAAASLLFLAAVFYFQSLYGELYKSVGILLAFFFFGIASGSIFTGAVKNYGRAAAITGIAASAGLFALMLNTGGVYKSINPNFIMLFVFSSGVAAGAAIAASFKRGSLFHAYGTCLAGLAAGCLFFGIVFLPNLSLDKIAVIDAVIFGAALVLSPGDSQITK